MPPPSVPTAARLPARLLPQPPALPYQPVVAKAPRAPAKPLEPQPSQAQPLPPAFAPTRETPAAATPVLPQVSGTAVNAEGLREYRISLARHLLQQLPPGMSGEMHGSLELGVAVSASGRVDIVTIVRSSGDARLDTLVLAALRTAVMSADLPVRLYGQGFVVHLPVEVGVGPTAVAGR